MKLAVLVQVFVTVLAVDLEEKEFRCDYEYVPEVDGWLKFHDIPANWYDARLRCHLEGTTLASPLNYQLKKAIRRISNQHGLFGRDIYTGIHSTFSKGDYFSIEGVPLSQISHHWAPEEPNNLDDAESCLYLTPGGSMGDINCDTPKPYVCYKMHVDNQELNECGTVDNEYTFDSYTGSCYKFHSVPRIYSRAFMACAAEGGYLSIINDMQEAEAIRNLFSKYPASSLVGPFYKDVATVGFNDWNEHGEWLTIHGESLQKAGYAKWAPGEPNNRSGEFCGGVFRSAKLLDLNCDTVHTFICEKSPGSLLCD